MKLLQEELVDTAPGRKSKYHAKYFKLKSEAIDLLKAAGFTSLEALREVPEGGSGVPNIDALVPVNLPSIEYGIELIESYLNSDNDNWNHEALHTEVMAIDAEDRREKLVRVLEELTGIHSHALARNGFILQTYKLINKEIADILNAAG